MLVGEARASCTGGGRGTSSSSGGPWAPLTAGMRRRRTGGTGGRLRVNIVKDASGEPRVYETATGLETERRRFILMSSSKDLRRALNVARLVVCERNRTTSAVTPGSFYGVDMSVHELFQGGLGV